MAQAAVRLSVSAKAQVRSPFSLCGIFVVDDVALGRVLLPALRFSTVIVIPQCLIYIIQQHSTPYDLIKLQRRVSKYQK